MRPISLQPRADRLARSSVSAGGPARGAQIVQFGHVAADGLSFLGEGVEFVSHVSGLGCTQSLGIVA